MNDDHTSEFIRYVEIARQKIAENLELQGRRGEKLHTLESPGAAHRELLNLDQELQRMFMQGYGWNKRTPEVAFQNYIHARITRLMPTLSAYSHNSIKGSICSKEQLIDLHNASNALFYMKLETLDQLIACAIADYDVDQEFEHIDPYLLKVRKEVDARGLQKYSPTQIARLYRKAAVGNDAPQRLPKKPFWPWSSKEAYQQNLYGTSLTGKVLSADIHPISSTNKHNPLIYYNVLVETDMGEHVPLFCSFERSKSVLTAGDYLHVKNLKEMPEANKELKLVKGTLHPNETIRIAHATDLAQDMVTFRVLQCTYAIRFNNDGHWPRLSIKCVITDPQGNFSDITSSRYELVSTFKTGTCHIAPAGAPLISEGTEPLPQDLQKLLWGRPSPT